MGTVVEFLEGQEMVATFAAIDPEKNVGKVNSNSNEEARNYISPLKALKIDSDDRFEIKTVKRKLILSFVVKALFVAILTIVALVLSLCHSSHQCYPPSQVSSPSPLSHYHLGIEGSVFKAKPEYSTPRSVKISWINVLAGGPDGFNMITESNNINETNFKISMNMTAEEFDQSITLANHRLNEISRDKTPEEIEEIKSFRLALGVIIGGDFQGGSTQRDWLRSCKRSCGSQWSVGPSGEKAWADRYAVFYKNGTSELLDLQACSWFNQLPQGFSCGKGSVPIQDCNFGFERFSPVPCDEIVLKVANQDGCPFDQVNYGPYYGGAEKQREGEYNLDEFDGEDCFAGVNWTPDP